jgi:tetratricopeptide (TPR) repeat protein
VYNNIGKLLVLMKKWSEAEEAFQRCIEVRKSIGWGSAAPARIVQYELNLVDLDVRREKWETAQTACERILASRPDKEYKLEAGALLAQVKLGQNRVSEAIKILESALQIKMFNKKLRILPLGVLSDAFERQSQWEDAYRAAKEAANLVPARGFGATAPALAVLYERLERMCGKTGRSAEASEWNQKAISLH